MGKTLRHRRLSGINKVGQRNMSNEIEQGEAGGDQHQGGRESVIPGVPVGFILETIRRIDQALAETGQGGGRMQAQKSPH